MTEERRYVCGNCSLKCEMTVRVVNGQRVSIEGSNCGQGADYVDKELLLEE